MTGSRPWRRRLAALAVASITTAALGATAGTASAATYAGVIGQGAKGQTGAAGLYAYGLGWDATDNTVVVADFWNYELERYSPAGSTAGSATRLNVYKNLRATQGSPGGMSVPYGIDVDAAGNIWVGDQNGGRVVEFSHDGAWLQTFPSTYGKPVGCATAADIGTTTAKMTYPTHVVASPVNDEVFVSDTRCKKVYIWNRVSGKLDGILNAFGGQTNPTPRGIDTDAAGNVYVAEHFKRTIWKCDPTGASCVPWVVDDTMLDPRGLQVDAARGKLYVVARGHNDVHVFDLNSTATDRGRYVFGGDNLFNSASFVTVDPNTGAVYVSDCWGYRIHKFTYPVAANGANATSNASEVNGWMAPQSPPTGLFRQQKGIAVNPANGDLFTVEPYNQRVQRFTFTPGGSPEYSYLLSFGTRTNQSSQFGGEFAYPKTAVFGGGNLFVGDDDVIKEYAPDGTWTGWGTASGPAVGQTKSPMGLAFASNLTIGGTTYAHVLIATDRTTCSVTRWDADSEGADGYASLIDRPVKGTAAGGAGCGASTTQAQLSGPRGMDVDSSGNMYVADSGNGRIVVLNPDGSLKYAPWRCPGVDGVRTLAFPQDTLVEGDGTNATTWVYVADSDNKRVVRAHPDGSGCELVTKGAEITSQPKGQTPTLHSPSYLERDGDRLLVSDSTYNRIYVFGNVF